MRPAVRDGAGDPKAIVRRGYDLVSRACRADDFAYAGSDYEVWLGRLMPHLADGARVLDLGCGCGVPVARELAKRCHVTGVDLSPVQIDRARQLVPGVRFACGDMTRVKLPYGAFDAVVSLYALIHVPLGQQPALLARIRSWLRPGGLLLATVGHEAWTGTEEDWRGVKGATMYWSHADVATYRRWFEAAGFEILAEDFQPEGSGGHTILLARAAGAKV